MEGKRGSASFSPVIFSLVPTYPILPKKKRNRTEPKENGNKEKNKRIGTSATEKEAKVIPCWLLFMTLGEPEAF